MFWMGDLSDLCYYTLERSALHCLPPHQVYRQLAEDDKVRYKTEIASWEEHMVEIGREDLVRVQTLSKKKKTAVKRPPAKKAKKTTAAKTLVRKAAKKPKKKSRLFDSVEP